MRLCVCAFFCDITLHALRKLLDDKRKLFIFQRSIMLLLSINVIINYFIVVIDEMPMLKGCLVCTCEFTTLPRMRIRSTCVMRSVYLN